jgi:hypothetical protein
MVGLYPKGRNFLYRPGVKTSYEVRKAGHLLPVTGDLAAMADRDR